MTYVSGLGCGCALCLQPHPFVRFPTTPEERYALAERQRIGREARETWLAANPRMTRDELAALEDAAPSRTPPGWSPHISAHGA